MSVEVWLRSGVIHQDPLQHFNISKTFVDDGLVQPAVDCIDCNKDVTPTHPCQGIGAANQDQLL